MIKEEGKDFVKITVPLERPLVANDFTFLNLSPHYLKTPEDHSNQKNEKLENHFLGLESIDLLNTEEAPYFFECRFYGAPKFHQYSLCLHWCQKELKIYHSNKINPEAILGLSLKDFLKKLTPEKEKRSFSARGKLKSITPNEETWKERVDKALNHKSFQKIVLSKEYQFEMSGEELPFKFFCQFDHQKDLFALCWDEFICFSPESLFKINVQEVLLEAIAGTRANAQGMSDEERLKVTQELSGDPKEQREHQDVVDEIKEAVSELGQIEEGQREVLTLKKLHHLRTPLKLQLKEAFNQKIINELITNLHPTPAVGGRPRAAAVELLKEMEPQRDKYAGVFGVCHEGLSWAAVLIRSFSLQKSILTAYAGAGIVDGSEPERESQEITNKIKSFIPCEYFEYE